jgi:putative restriction endonuclease
LRSLPNSTPSPHMAQNRWTREELIVALNLYLKLPFGKLHSRNPDIIHLAELMGRTSGSVAMRLNNFASVDPYHKQRGIGGLPGGKAQVEPIWAEFLHNREDLIFESERILAQWENKTLESKYSADLPDLSTVQGETALRMVKTRVNQHVFRQMVLANYQNRCAITGINIPSLLVASHIIPWAANAKERLNPENGICLSPLYDRAFDQGLIGITQDLEVRVSERLRIHKGEPFYQIQFGILQGSKLREAGKYRPKKEFLVWHIRNAYFSETNPQF